MDELILFAQELALDLFRIENFPTPVKVKKNLKQPGMDELPKKPVLPGKLLAYYQNLCE